MKKLYFYVPFLSFLVLVIFFSIQLLSEKDPSELPSVLINKKLPEIKLTELENYNNLNSQIFFNTKKAYLINVWASWCAPCLVEHEYLMKLKEAHNVIIYGINYKDSITNSKYFIENYGNPFEAIGVDESGREVINLGVYGVPETFIVDTNGYIKYRHVGPILDYDMNNIILPILKNLEKNN